MVITFYKKFFHFTLLSIIILTCYIHTLHYSWHFDDTPNILENHNIQINSLSWGEIKQSIYSPILNRISRPVANISFALNYYTSGKNPFSYHVVNILIHIIAAFVIYLIFNFTLPLLKTNKSYIAGYASDIALLGATLWAIHPIQTQAITYIVQRMTSFAALFCLLSFYLYIKARTSEKKLKKFSLIIIAILLWLLAIGTKENTFLLPLAILGYEVVFFNVSLLSNKRYILPATIFIFLITALAIGLYFDDLIEIVQEGYKTRTFTLWQRIITQPIILLKYLYLILFFSANHQVLETDMLASQSILDPFTMLSNIAIFLLIFTSVVFMKKFPILLYSLYFYFVNIFIESSFIPLELYFEHRNYLPSVFIFLAISYYTIKLISNYNNKNKLFMKYFILISVLVMLICEGNAAYSRNEVWRDEITLHEDTIAKAPINPRPYVAIAVENISKNNYDEALRYLKIARDLYKSNPGRFQLNWISLIYFNMGLVYRANEETDKSIGLLLKSIELDPTNWRAHLNLGILFFSKNDYDSAEVSFRNAVQLHPSPPADLYNLLGRCLYATKKFNEAIDFFKLGLSVDEMNTLHYNLIACYLKIGRTSVALHELSRMNFSNRTNDGIYYLYAALLSPEPKRTSYLEKVAALLVLNNDVFCTWLFNLQQNNSYYVIFPDISSISNDLISLYQNELGRKNSLINTMIDKAGKCIQ